LADAIMVQFFTVSLTNAWCFYVYLIKKPVIKRTK